jgi:hypothetical protein
MTFDERRPFVSAEDFDATGILAGVDPCASNYWWIPELYGPDWGPDGGPDLGSAQIRVRLAEKATGPAGASDRDQATRRTASRTTAAA